jgi:aerobic-type carbon monoxide dehydrogenase small subunit (CoxS/CutS family)
MRIALQVNGRRHTVDVDPSRSLLDVLREELGLTGTHYGCGESQCGACTVHLGGRAVHACVTPVSDAAGKPVTTIEGLATGGRLHPVQRAFLDEEAFQCAYCTPGMIMAGAALLAGNPRPTDAEIVRGMEGNVCRCGTQPRIVAAIRRAAGLSSGGGAAAKARASMTERRP